MPYTKSAKKAKASMAKQYGPKKGNQVFYATANKRGKGKSQSARVNSAFRSRSR